MKTRAWRRGCGRTRRQRLSRRVRRRTRARELAALGFGLLEALHLVFAEQAKARWFVTTDDRLLKRASTERERLRVEVLKPDQVPLELSGGKA